jgi:hypothetical protein
VPLPHGSALASEPFGNRHNGVGSESDAGRSGGRCRIPEARLPATRVTERGGGASPQSRVERYSVGVRLPPAGANHSGCSVPIRQDGPSSRELLIPELPTVNQNAGTPTPNSGRGALRLFAERDWVLLAPRSPAAAMARPCASCSGPAQLVGPPHCPTAKMP